MAKTDRKEKLFQDFYYAVSNSFQALESQYDIKGVIEQLLGNASDEEQAKAKLRSSRSWQTLSALYDYSVDGITNDADPMDIVIDGSDVIKLATSENYAPSQEWDDIVAMGDGRYALDEGQPFMLFKLALLANVDIRTVRNAVSSGDLVTFKSGDMIHVENASARRWLLGRRGFKPTVVGASEAQDKLENVNSPAAFGAFLVGQRQRIGMGQDTTIDAKLVAFHPSATPQAMTQLEAGVFALPLDAVFPVADFYQLDRKAFLECVMRVFFYEELLMLTPCQSECEGG